MHTRVGPPTLGVFGLGLSLLAGPALASELFDLQSTCTATNCLTQQVLGDVYNNTAPGHTGHKPWVAQLYTSGQECVRVEVVFPTTGGPSDLEAALTCPGGRTWIDDDSGVGLAPLIKANGTLSAGWCTVTIGHFAGSNVETSFDMRWGRYNTNNPNCLPATPPS